MKTIREIFRIGYGPSSSHTMGPRKAAEIFLERYANAAKYQAHLYGSLSATGKGHLTDAAIIDVIPSVEIVWHDEFLPFHPNGMRFCAWNDRGELLDEWTVYSVGGGALEEDPDNSIFLIISPTTLVNALDVIGLDLGVSSIFSSTAQGSILPFSTLASKRVE